MCVVTQQAIRPSLVQRHNTSYCWYSRTAVFTETFKQHQQALNPISSFTMYIQLQEDYRAVSKSVILIHRRDTVLGRRLQKKRRENISRVPDQNGVSQLYITLEIHYSGREPSIYFRAHLNIDGFRPECCTSTIYIIVEIYHSGWKPLI